MKVGATSPELVMLSANGSGQVLNQVYHKGRCAAGRGGGARLCRDRPGKFAEAMSWLKRGLKLSEQPGVSPYVIASFHALLGITALRRGEIENCLECLGASSCIFPIDRQAAHVEQSGSRDAILHFMACLEWTPGDLRARWLLNLAYMTVNEYPQNVARAYLTPLDTFRSKLEISPFENVTQRVGLGGKRSQLGRRQHF